MYSREIDGKTITIAPSGWTYERTFVLFDRETGSLWYTEEGQWAKTKFEARGAEVVYAREDVAATRTRTGGSASER